MGHDRVSWSARKESRTLRNMPQMIRWMDHDPHRELHDACPAVPVLGSCAMQLVLNEYHPHRDTVKNMDNLLHALDVARNHPRAHELERNLADLAMWAFELQLPFLLDNRNNLEN